MGIDTEADFMALLNGCFAVACPLEDYRIVSTGNSNETVFEINGKRFRVSVKAETPGAATPREMK